MSKCRGYCIDNSSGYANFLDKDETLKTDCITIKNDEIKINDNYNNKILIEIPLEEYKELLMIKGKYEELKSQQNNYIISGQKITYYKNGKEYQPPYNPHEVTC